MRVPLPGCVVAEAVGTALLVARLVGSGIFAERVILPHDTEQPEAPRSH